jgi:carboxylesterase type B
MGIQVLLRRSCTSLMAISVTLFCVLSSTLFSIANANPLKVTLSTRTYQGITLPLANSTNGVHIFLGIPFAAPPLGPLRFAPPHETITGNQPGEQLAAHLPPACIQNGGGSKLPESEDCLYLNIYAPASAEKNISKPVMIWLYGGGLQYGAASQPLYNGASFSGSQDVIIVVPNYRLNVFGFPGEIPGIPLKDRNLGLVDQRQAFLWVQENIAKFGGDPKKVTLFGESAGARSADFHLLTLWKNPPFRAVIMQSGSAELTPLADMKKAKDSSAKGSSFLQLAHAFNCTDEKVLLECMRKVPAISIKQKMGEMALYFGSVDDGGFAAISDQTKVRKAHRAANVPLLIGTNADEVRGGLHRLKEISLDEYLNDAFYDQPELKIKLSRAYAPGVGSPYRTDFDAIAAIGTDMSFNCITAREAKISAEAGYPTWRYLFNASYPNTEKFPGGGANHAHEIQFIFGNLPNKSTMEEIALSRLMQKTWADFAKSPEAGPGWDKYGVAGGRDLGHFRSDGKLFADSPSRFDRNCHIFESMYTGRA